MQNKVPISRLPTGVPGLDAIIGGGLPELSFNLILGTPGTGKSTLAHQIMFALASPERPALFFTVLGEPPLKMLRYQQQFSFFDFTKVNQSIRFVNLSDEVAMGRFEHVLASISAAIEATSPALVFIDSFNASMQAPRASFMGELNQQQLIHQIGIRLSTCQATTFLIGEFLTEPIKHPILTVADGIISLEQSVYRNSMVRKMQVLKMRGQSTPPGLHAFRIDENGLSAFPVARIHDDSGATTLARPDSRPKTRISMGVPELDAMLGGGLPEGYSLLVAGPSGSGKTMLATTFLAEGVRLGEPGIIVAFEQTPSQSLNRTINEMVQAGQIGLINMRLPDLSIDEVVQQLTGMIQRMQATRIVIDSLSGFELAVAPSFRADFRESLFRMVAVLSNLGVTVLMTSELEDRYIDLRFSPYGSAFLTDAIIVQRYIELESRLKRVMAVVKVRSSKHSNEIREFEISDSKIFIGKRVDNYDGLLCGQPIRTRVAQRANED